VEMSDRGGQATDGSGACALHFGYLRLQIHVHNMEYLMLFHWTNGCMNAPQCYVLPTLPVLSFLFLEISWNFPNVVNLFLSSDPQ